MLLGKLTQYDYAQRISIFTFLAGLPVPRTGPLQGLGADGEAITILEYQIQLSSPETTIFNLILMSSSNNEITGHGHREARWKIGHSRCELDDSETIDVGNGEHPMLPTVSPLESPSVSCLMVGEELEACMETSGSTKVDGQCWVCCRVFAGRRGLRVHLAKTDCGVVVESSTCLLRRYLFLCRVVIRMRLLFLYLSLLKVYQIHLVTRVV